MKKLLFFSLVAVISICFTLPAAAQIYKYTTKEGQTFYTNDPNQVPQEYRDQVEHMYETQPGPANNTAVQPPVDDNTADNSGTARDTSMYANPELEAKRGLLENEKTQLENIYNDLSARKLALEEQRKEVAEDDQEGLKAFNETVNQLNKEVEEYQTRTDKYNSDLRAFNLEVMEQSER